MAAMARPTGVVRSNQNRTDADRAGEVVRSCMIESRKTSITSYTAFQTRLRASHARLAR
jgi:hypothetical protein